ncbi:MAG: sigma-54-dependent Fis family transcriptional regulator [Deltaproteobacteria bacterium]|nr:sigma-54-dependent Fis family transcriptional regulator [Deltaproteobacteria bacterium]
MISPDPSKVRVLVVDDQKNMRATTAMLLRSAGYATREASGAEEALSAISAEPVDVVLTDLRMEPVDGLALLKRLMELKPSPQVVVMTAYGTIESAVEAMRLGAFDYVTKPFKEEELLLRVERASERQQLMTESALLAADFSQRHGLSALVGRSSAMRELVGKIVRVAPSDVTVLVQGESGTGKELVARAIHAASRRAERPFVPVNCAAISETLLESELFGHAKGSFTGAVRARRGLFEEAHGGTLFMDEVSETGQAFQSKLLRVLQEGEVRRVGESSPVPVDVRVVAATNQDLERAVADKRFRQDLFYRLAVVTLRVPALRERRDDIPLLAEHFLSRYRARTGQPRRLSPAAMERLTTHDFPGNVRELENAVEQAAALADGEELGPGDFPLRPPRDPGSAPTAASVAEIVERGSLADTVEAAERVAIDAAIRSTGGDLGEVARRLDVSPTTLWRKMKRYGLKAG